MIKTILVVIVLLNVQVNYYDTIKVQAVDNKPNLVLLGDSITAIKYRENSYSDLLESWWFDKVEVINEGIGGSCLRDVDIESRITSHHPKYLIIEYGLNDVAVYGNATEFYNHYNRVLNETRRQNPNITIFLSTITWVSWSHYPEEKQIEFKDKIVQIANEQNLTLANLWDKFYRNESLMCDGAHQNELGALVIANTFNETFFDVIDGSPYSYWEEVQVSREVNINLNLNLNLNVSLPEEYVQENNFINLTLYLFSFSFVLAISVILFEEIKKLTKKVIKVIA